MNSTTGVALRGDLNTVVVEANAADNYFIADKIFTPYPVGTKNGQYPKIERGTGETIRAASTIRKPHSSYGEITRQWVSDTYDCVDRGLIEKVDDVEVHDLARYFDLEAMAARLTLRNVRLQHEVTCAALINATGTFTDYANSAVAYTYGNLATIDFPYDVLAAIERVNSNGNEANTILIPGTVWARLKASTKLQNFCRGSRPSDSSLNLTAGTIAAGFADSGITQVLIGRAIQNTAMKGQSISASAVWGTTYCWVGDCRTGIAEAGGAARKFTWTPDGGEWITETYRDEECRSNVVRVRHNTAEKIIDASAGTLIVTQWS
jgi:hypothetical protein